VRVDPKDRQLGAVSRASGCNRRELDAAASRSRIAAARPPHAANPRRPPDAPSDTERTAMQTESTRLDGWWTSLLSLPTRMLTALVDSTRDWRRGCGL
jgi:hypothetical protein